MKCDECQTPIPSGDGCEHLGRTLCEDCYMVALSPMKTCDPWAVHSAKTYEKHALHERPLTDLQQEMVQLLEAEGPLAPRDLQAKLHDAAPRDELERAFAALRHMEKARAVKQGSQVLWRLW